MFWTIWCVSADMICWCHAKSCHGSWWAFYQVNHKTQWWLLSFTHHHKALKVFVDCSKSFVSSSLSNQTHIIQYIYKYCTWSCGKEKFPFTFSLLRFSCKHPQPRWIDLSVKCTSKLATVKLWNCSDIAVFAFSDLSRFLVTVEI